ncbi:MAG: ferritin family protein [Pseudomonadota bacterium]
MASECPKCHQQLEDDSICCAALRYTWKCKSCGKLSTGFAVPYGRCYLCAGKIEVVKAYKAEDVQSMRAIEEAVQFEIDSYHFYRLGWQRAKSPLIRAIFEQMYLKEQDHIAELEEKYHVHMEKEILQLNPGVDDLLSRDLFKGIDFRNPTEQVEPLYEKAIEMEIRTRDHFQKRAQDLPEGPEKEIYRELAAEEEEHVAMLETELEQFTSKKNK